MPTTGLIIRTTIGMQLLKKTSGTLFTKTVAVHSAAWALFIAYEISVLFYSASKLKTGGLEPFIVYACYYGLNISFFYSHVGLLNYTFSRSKPRYIQGAVLLLGLIVLYLFFKFLANHFLQTPHPAFHEQLKYFSNFVVSTLFRGIYFMLLATFYWAAGYISHYKKQLAASERRELVAMRNEAEMERRLAEARNAYYRQQINPHMLFNALNFIYSSVSGHSKKASRCIILLSDILRFSLKEAGPDGKVPLAEEIVQLHNLLEINQYRFRERLNTEFQTGGDHHDHRIIPLVLFTLTENFFKHGDLLQTTFRAELRITIDEKGILTFYSRNIKKAKNDHLRSGQLGLKNLRTRLDFSYPDNYQIAVSETGNIYELTLTLKL